MPNAARRTAGGRAGNAVPGLRRGVFDLCIHGPWQRVFYMEVKKDERETLSKEQIQFQEQMTLRGISTAVCWSLETAMTQMKAWGLLQVGIIINGKRI